MNAATETYSTDATAVCSSDCVEATPYVSIIELEMGYITEMEMTQSGCDVAFTPDQALSIFNQDFTASPNTFLNPENYYNF